MVAPVVNSSLESAILNRIVEPQQGRWPPEAAQAVLSLALSPEDREKMNGLAQKSAAGKLTTDEELEIESYRQVCRLVDLLKARARVSLAQSAPQRPPV